MPDFPYTSNTGRLKSFLRLIQDTGVPQKVHQQYLISVGFKSRNDRSILRVLRSLGFIDGSSAPTSLWSAYRDREQAPAVLAGAMRSMYKELFDTWPDAYRQPDETLRNWFSARSTLGKVAIDAAVATFKALASLADFQQSPIALGTNGNSSMPSEQVRVAAASASVHTLPQIGSQGLTLNVNIQLQLPATDDAMVYDNLFQAMAKHLLRRE